MSLSVSDPHRPVRRSECVARSFSASPPEPRAAAASPLRAGSAVACLKPPPANKSDSLTSRAQDWAINPMDNVKSGLGGNHTPD